MITLKNLLLSSLISLILNNPLSTNNTPPIELIVKESPKERVIKDNWTAVSVDLGDVSDQKAFVDYFKKNYPNHVHKFNGYYFPIPWTLDELPSEKGSTKINGYALENTKKLDNILKDAQIIHFSGHHYVKDDLFFSRIDFKDNVYVWSAVNLTNLSAHNNVEIVFLNACNTVSIFSKFTINLRKVFPNAILLGYDSNSAEGIANARLLEEFFNSLECKDIFDTPKKELGELWVKAGKKVYEKQDRDLRASWAESDTLYELSSRLDKLYRIENFKSYDIFN